MITLAQYAGPWKGTPAWTREIEVNARQLLITVNALQEFMIANGVAFPINPATNSNVSGKRYGGFRPPETTVGAARSNHKRALAIDLFDPVGKIDAWCMAHLPQLEAFGIWIEHPERTSKWAHWQIVPPASGNRVFYP